MFADIFKLGHNGLLSSGPTKQETYPTLEVCRETETKVQQLQLEHLQHDEWCWEAMTYCSFAEKFHLYFAPYFAAFFTFAHSQKSMNYFDCEKINARDNKHVGRG